MSPLQQCLQKLKEKQQILKQQGSNKPLVLLSDAEEILQELEILLLNENDFEQNLRKNIKYVPKRDPATEISKELY
jgi:flagellin-specific chaperone FliS